MVVWDVGGRDKSIFIIWFIYWLKF
jgi:hypothetical protein